MACRAVVIAALAFVFGAGRAGAFLETGTLLTNAASATYSGGGQGASVSFSATMKVLLANPSLFLWKATTPTIVTSVGGYVTNTISFSNGGANTAFIVTINDKLPNGAGCWFMQQVDAWSGSGVPAASWSGNNTSWAAGAPPVGQTSATSIFLRWIVPSLGVGVSGVITFVVSFG
ncbi:MAG: hypothetical protein AAB152_18625 [Candidatus Coatesbacteria bacterium]